MSLAIRFMAVGRGLAARCRVALGLPARLPSPDRDVLERDILIALASDPAVSRVLFVGCDWYTAHYERLLPGVTVHTIDPDPRRRRFGAARHHVAPLQRLAKLFPVESFDAVVCNGVYGWGLDAREDCEHAFAACASRLRPAGWFILGWNDVPAHDPAPLAAVSLDGFEPARFAPFDAPRFRVPGSYERHTFAFFRRAQAVSKDCSGRR